jgi:riboflavin kinase/FMN adenylyltransferase
MYRIEGNFVPNFVKDSIVSIGIFDGIHLGHKLILDLFRENKKNYGLKSVIITFHPHPEKVLNSEREIFLLSSLDERLKLFEEYEIDFCWILEANKSFLALEPEVFIKEYVWKTTSPRKIIVGENFRFGQDCSGDKDLLIKLGEGYNFSVDLVPLKKFGNENISSSAIRFYLMKGEIDKVKAMLGRYPLLEARVVKGDKRGRKLGFPTANLLLNYEFKLGHGVYIIETEINEKSYHGLLYVGTIPTFGVGKESYEVYIVNFSENIYGKILKLKIVSKLRDEKCFPSQRELGLQLQYDKRNLIRYLSYKPYYSLK